MARKPKDIEHGKHSFQGLRYDRNGNPLYTSNTLSNDEAKEMGWKFSKKHGLYGQINDPTKFYESKKQVIRLTESDLHRVIKESVNNILSELDWKTYANAARLTKDRQFRSFDFAEKAADEFNKKHKLEDYDNDEYYNRKQNRSRGDFEHIHSKGLTSSDILHSKPKDDDVNNPYDENVYYRGGKLPINIDYITSAKPDTYKTKRVQYLEDIVDEETGEVKKVKRNVTITPKTNPWLYKKSKAKENVRNYLNVDTENHNWFPYGLGRHMDKNNPDYSGLYMTNIDYGRKGDESYKNDKILQKHMNKNYAANKDFDDYLRGNSRYIKGKGWVDWEPKQRT